MSTPGLHPAVTNYHAGMVSSPGYSRAIFDARAFSVVVDVTAEFLGELIKTKPFQAIAALGNSGVVLAGAVGYKLGIPLLIVRKNLENTHDSRWCNGYFGCDHYVIVDDLISSGATVDNTINRIERQARHFYEDYGYKDKSVPRCAGVVLYDSDRTQSYWHHDERNLEPVIEIPVYTVSGRCSAEYSTRYSGSI